MLRNISIALSFLLLISPCLSFGQGAAKKTESYVVGASQKIYVHTDRQQYFSGENLWYKIYLLTKHEDKQAENQKLAYVEILDKDKIPVLQPKTLLQGRSGASSIYLPSNLISGNYLFRAYTESMLSNQEPNLFEKEIRILNVKDGLSQEGNTSAVKYDLQLFPEGGDIIEGVATKLAYKLTNSFGIGVDFEGVILDEEENIVKEIKSLKFGIGSSSFAPVENRRYKIKIYLKDGNIVTKNIPTPRKSGYILNVTQQPNQLRARVMASKDLSGKTVSIVFNSNNGVEKYREKVTVSANAPRDIFVQLDKLEEGISLVTLLDDQNVPVVERLVFKRPKEVNIEFNKVGTYSERNKVEIGLSAALTKGLNSDLSVSVYKADTTDYEDLNIDSYLLLSSELKGKIESIDYYLSTNTQETSDALDNLMLTHGWRRLKKGVEKDLKQPISDYTYYGQRILGKVKTKDGTPVAGVLTYLSVPGSDRKLFTALTDKEGLATFDVKNYYGSGEVILQTDDPKRSEYTMEIISPFYKGAGSFIIGDLDPRTINKDNYLANGIAVQVENSYRLREKNTFSRPVRDSIPFYFKADKLFNLDDYTRFRTMEEVLREYISGLAVRKAGDSYSLHLLDANRGYHFDKQPLILFNDVPVLNTNKIIAYDPLKIKSIELIYKRYYYGPLVADGIVNFKTYDNDAPALELDAKALSTSYDGLQISREFYSPVYETPEQKNSRIPDFRTLLYWNPKLTTDNEGKATLKFYTSDRKGTFKVVINGIGQGGELVKGVTTIKVQ